MIGAGKICIALGLVIVASLLSSTEGQKVLPGKFLGSFKLEKDENFDEYLAEKGFGFFMRKIIMLASVTKVFRNASTEKANRYDMENLTTKKNTLFADWALDEPFIAESLDDTNHRIVFTLTDANNTLIEKHVKLISPNDEEEYEYSISGDYLVMKVAHKNVVAKRYYKKQ